MKKNIYVCIIESLCYIAIINNVIQPCLDKKINLKDHTISPDLKGPGSSSSSCLVVCRLWNFLSHREGNGRAEALPQWNVGMYRTAWPDGA